MGFSVSASTAIIFAGLFLAAGILYPAMDNGMERVQDAENDRDKAQLDLRNTAIEIDADGTNSDQITMVNTGSTSINVDKIDLLVDGDYFNRDRYTTEVDNDGSTSLWLPGEALVINDFSGAERIKVVTDNGVSVTATDGEEI